jgi:hypothetical protein
MTNSVPERHSSPRSVPSTVSGKPIGGDNRNQRVFYAGSRGARAPLSFVLGNSGFYTSAVRKSSVRIGANRLAVSPILLLLQCESRCNRPTNQAGAGKGADHDAPGVRDCRARCDPYTAIATGYGCRASRRPRNRWPVRVVFPPPTRSRASRVRCGSCGLSANRPVPSDNRPSTDQAGSGM